MPVPIRRIVATTLRGALTKKSLVGSLSHRVYPRYVDLYFHMNYASYLEVMEIGRWNYIVTSGVLKAFIKNKIFPVVVAVDIQYLRELRALQKFRLDTRVVGIEGKCVIFEQVFLVKDRIHAKATVRALGLYEKKKVINAEQQQELFAPFVTTPLAAEEA